MLSRARLFVGEKLTANAYPGSNPNESSSLLYLNNCKNEVKEIG